MLIEFNKATKYMADKKYEKAVLYYKRELKQAQYKECYLNLGNCYRYLGKDDLAIDCYLKAADSKIPFADGKFGVYTLALNNLGLFAYASGDDDLAIAYYRAALHNDPLMKDAIWNHASASLRKFCSNEDIDVQTAWRMYDYRFDRSNATKIDTTIPRWDMNSHGNKIVVCNEQGFGDKLHFGRYVHMLQHYFSEVWVQCPEELNVFFSDFKTCTDVAQSGAECSIPLCNLAQKFGVIPGDWLRDKFVARKFDNTKLNVAIEWQGSTTHTNDYNRSCLPTYFQPLRKLCNLYTIRPGAPSQPGVIALNSQSWRESAELVSGMDLVISVDTSIVHLAGALGMPCWMLQPRRETDFRWGNDSMGFDNIWYKSVEVFRNPNSWQVVFKAVEQRLQELVQQRKYKQLQSTLHSLLEPA